MSNNNGKGKNYLDYDLGCLVSSCQHPSWLLFDTFVTAMSSFAFISCGWALLGGIQDENRYVKD